MTFDKWVRCAFGGSLLTLIGCSSADSSASAPGGASAGGVQFAVSGEVLALTGYAFPPRTMDDPAFVDGWDVQFDRLLVTVDKITLSSDPDRVPGDPSQTGAVVAEVDGPWAVDLHRSDPSNLAGKGGSDEQAVPIASVANQNRNGGAAFEADARYAFGFDVVAANPSARMVNLDDAAKADYDEMVKKQCAVFYAGTATFRGDKSNASCYPDDRKSFPDVVRFRLCFKTPTTYTNCQNPDNDPAMPFPSEEHVRGVPIDPHKSVVAQVTIHTDHPFWDSVVHESPAHFDQYAARAVVDGGGSAMVTLEDTQGVDYSSYVDTQNHTLNWRYCIEPSTAAHPKFTGKMAFDPESVPHAIGMSPATGLRDYYDFAAYDQSTQGHLNSDGLCFVRRNYPSPP